MWQVPQDGYFVSYDSFQHWLKLCIFKCFYVDVIFMFLMVVHCPESQCQEGEGIYIEINIVLCFIFCLSSIYYVSNLVIELYNPHLRNSFWKEDFAYFNTYKILLLSNTSVS